LVNQLVAAGMVYRAVDPADRRAAHLSLTDAARERLARWRSARGVLVADAMDRLPAADVAALEAALPALKNLVRELS
jgi:DNA-binding MarR family transcriptional regulator